MIALAKQIETNLPKIREQVLGTATDGVKAAVSIQALIANLSGTNRCSTETAVAAEKAFFSVVTLLTDSKELYDVSCLGSATARMLNHVHAIVYPCNVRIKLDSKPNHSEGAVDGGPRAFHDSLGTAMYADYAKCGAGAVVLYTECPHSLFDSAEAHVKLECDST